MMVSLEGNAIFYTHMNLVPFYLKTSKPVSNNLYYHKLSSD